MGRQHTFQGSNKTVAAATAQTITFTPQDIESAGLINLMFAWTGAGNTNADIDRVRVRAGADVIFDCSWLELQAYQQAYSLRHVSNLDAGTAFSVPLNFLDPPRREDADVCQFPPDRDINVEIVTLNTTVAGTLTCAWSRATPDIPAAYWMQYYSNVLSISASAFNSKYSFSEEGVIRGITLPVAGVAKAELFISGRQAWRLPGPQFGGVTIGDLLTEMDYFSDGISVSSAKHHRVDLGIPAVPGSSYLLLDTGAAWAGLTNAAAFYAVQTLPSAAAR